MSVLGNSSCSLTDTPLAPDPDDATAIMDSEEATWNMEDLNDEIVMYREVLTLYPAPDPNSPVILNNLASFLYTRFNLTGKIEDLNEAISLHRDALAMRTDPDPDRSASLNNLATVLHTRFTLTGRIEDMNEAISMHREALTLFPARHPARSGALNNLANVLVTRFERTGGGEDMNEAISLYQEALELQPPDRSASLNNLASVLDMRFNLTRNMEDVNEAISLHREALILRSAPHLNRSSSVNNLANALTTRFSQTGDIEDINEAISLHREALKLRPGSHPDRSSSLNNLASALEMRFYQTGNTEDVNEATSLHREALMPGSSPYLDRSSALNNLANVLQNRFNQTDDLQDVNEAISLHRDVLALRPAPHPNRPGSLNNLACVLDTRFSQTENIEDLDEAISLFREALTLVHPSHPDRSTALNNLAIVLNKGFDQTQSLDDVNEAISLHREALTLRPAPHPWHSDSLNNLASSLRKRYGQRGSIEDMNEAIVLWQAAVRLFDTDHPNICVSSSNLGIALNEMYSQTHQPAYQDDAITSFRSAVACQSAPASKRFDVAKLWAHHADHANHGSAFEAYQSAIQLLPHLAMLGLDLQSRTQVLVSRSDGLARNAAACAIRSGQPDQAVELLEQGRGTFWSQALRLRTPLDELRLDAPDLAKRLQNASRALERGSLRDHSIKISDSGRRISLEQENIHFQRLNNEWLKIVEEIRQRDKFQDFLLPKSIDTLRQAASNGTVVILNASHSSCDALMVTLSCTKHLTLPDITYGIAQSLARLLQAALFSNATVPIPPLPEVVEKELMEQMQLSADDSKSSVNQWPPYISKNAGRPWHPVDSEGLTADHQTILQAVLAMLWKWVAEPVIRVLELKKTESPPRIWWCPTGPFTFLPLHAAGLYPQYSVADYFISSYTPTLSALLGQPPLEVLNFKLLVAIQPNTPGHETLRYTSEELTKVESIVREENLIKLGVDNVPASVENVLSHLSDVSIAHFACHGVQDMSNPLDSGLILDKGEKLKISQLMGKQLQEASLVFLSACQTAMGDEDLPDEAIHIAASMLFVGFRGVVATMWSMEDEDGPKITDSFYRHLFNNNSSSGPDTSQAALALHLAVKQLREDGHAFRRWVPFIHLGR